MAKIRVEQIKNLGIVTENGLSTIQIGAENSIVPLTSVSTEIAGDATGYISGVTHEGNVIKLTRTALPTLSIPEVAGDFVLGATVDETNKHQINLTKGTFDVTFGETIGSLTFAGNKLAVNETWLADKINTVAGVNDADLKVKFGSAEAVKIFSANASTEGLLELAAVAGSGAAADVKLSEGVSVITATDVEAALVEIATEIDAMDLTATDVVALNADKTALQAGQISETDGKVAVGSAATLVEFNQALSSTNKVATMADVTAAQNNATVAGQDAIAVANAPEGQTGKVVSLKINSNDTVLTQDTTGLLANISLTYDSTNKKIKLFGKEGVNAATPSLGEIDASDFIKDGMLESAVLVTNPEGQAEGKYIQLTFNLTDAQGGNDPIFINVSDLVDVYTADETYIALDTDNKFSHKTQANFSTEGATVNFGATADATADAAEESIEFKVPSFTVDAAGHVTAAEDKTIKVALPAAPATTTKTIVTYEPKREVFTSTPIELDNEAYDYDVYLNGQLLSAGDATLGTDKKTITLYSYAGMIAEGDEIIVRYFVKHEENITVFDTTVTPAE